MFKKCILGITSVNISSFAFFNYAPKKHINALHKSRDKYIYVKSGKTYLYSIKCHKIIVYYDFDENKIIRPYYD